MICKPGDRVRLLNMGCDPNPIIRGSLGTVVNVSPFTERGETKTQIAMKWDSGRTLAMVHPVDTFEVLE